MTVTTSSIREQIDRISRDSSAPSPDSVASQLVTAHGTTATLAAIDDLAADANWSQDREPYAWLAEVRSHARVSR